MHLERRCRIHASRTRTSPHGNAGRGAGPPAEKRLQRIGKDGDGEEEYEVNDRIEGLRDEMVPKMR